LSNTKVMQFASKLLLQKHMITFTYVDLEIETSTSIWELEMTILLK